MLTDLLFRLRALFRRQAVEADLDDELRFHFERLVEKYVQSGLARDQALRRARLDFGGLEQAKERCRDVRGTRGLERLGQDVRFGWRMLSKDRGFTAVAVITLAFALGANTAIFSIVDAVLIQPLPYADPHGLVWMFCQRVDRAKAPFSIADFEDYRRQGRSARELAAFSTWGANLTGEGRAERIQGVKITGNFLSTLGVKPILGRGLDAADDSPAAPPAVVLTYGLWQRLFGADPRVMGRTILLNGRRYEVIGVLPQRFFFPQRDAEIASALILAADPRRADRGDRFLRVVGRLRPGVTAEHSTAELSAIAARLQRLYPLTNVKNTGVRAIPMDQEIIGNLRTALMILGGAVAMVLLLACANLGHLLLARFSARHHEIAVRRALGATTGGLVRQFLVESCLIAAAGAALGVVFARWCIPLLLRLSPEQVPDVGAIGVDPRVLLFVGMISLLAVTLFGSWPAVLASRCDPAAAIKASGPSLAGASGAGLRKLLIALEAALAVVLLTGAGLFAKSFARLAQVDLGFNPRGVLAMRLSLPSQRYAAPLPVAFFAQRLDEALGSLPGVDALGMSSSLPLSGTWAADDFTIAGRPPLKTSETPSAQFRVVTPGYFQTMAIPLAAGRVFGEDDRLETRPVVIVNKTLAARFWPQASPLGAHLKLGGYAPAAGDPEIVGVVGDVKHLQIDEEPTVDIYVPLRQVSMGYLPYLVNGMWWVVRSTGEPGALAAPVRAAVRAADPDVATSRMAPLSRFVGDAVALRRFNAWLAGAFGAAAVLLAALGIYGVIAFSVAQRQREIGLRMAFGARPAGILRLVIAQGLTLALAGVAGGVLASWLLTRLAARLLYGIGANDPATLWEAACVLLGTALLASYVPARRAASVDPMVTLRHE
jgi:putative ABC transport system permease protein